MRLKFTRANRSVNPIREEIILLMSHLSNTWHSLRRFSEHLESCKLSTTLVLSFVRSFVLIGNSNFFDFSAETLSTLAIKIDAEVTMEFNQHASVCNTSKIDWRNNNATRNSN